MLCLLLRLRNEVVKTNQHNVNEVIEAVCHGALEGGSSIFQAKGHDSICEGAPWGCECALVMIFFSDLDLVISRKSVHEGKDLICGACINNLIDEGCGKVVFETHPVEVAEVCAKQMVPYFLFTGTGLETQVVYAMG